MWSSLLLSFFRCFEVILTPVACEVTESLVKVAIIIADVTHDNSRDAQLRGVFLEDRVGLPHGFLTGRKASTCNCLVLATLWPSSSPLRFSSVLRTSAHHSSPNSLPMVCPLYSPPRQLLLKTVYLTNFLPWLCHSSFDFLLQ